MYLPGDPSTRDPSRVFFMYDLVDGKGFKENQVYVLPSPDLTKSMQTLWKEGIEAIRNREGCEG